MRTRKGMRGVQALLAGLLLTGALAAPAVCMALEPTVDVGAASSFAVLGGSTVTNTGATVITGDLGVSPGTAVTGFPPGLVSGTIHAADAAALAAQGGVTDASNDAAGRPTTADLTGQDLGGLTLTSGVYNFDTSAQLTGALTLDGQGDPDAVFIFKIGSTLTLASSSSVNLINSARFSRVLWQVGSSATLGTSSHLEGNILALASISANTGATFRGRLLARTGAVTLDTNTITDAEPSIQVVKVPNPLALPLGPGPVSYTYTVTTTGTVDLTGVSVTDDMLSTVTYASGDANSDTVLQPTETWIYSAATILTVTTTNTATAAGTGNGQTTTDTASATVIVTDVPPAIHVEKTAVPAALPSGPASVTYTYTVTNPGQIDLTSVGVTDDRLSPVTYSSGDANTDGILQPGETWIYGAETFLSATTSNTATASGSGNGQTVTDTAEISVVVTPLPTPEIHIAKVADPTALPSGPGSVTYTYTVTNPGEVPLTSVSVTDNRLSPVTYVSGDTNGDDVLQPGETWVFTGTADLDETTTNTGTAHGTGGGETVTDTDQVTVVVAAPPAPAIHVAKAASPTALTSGPGSVTYTYTVTNPGDVPLTSVSVTDNRLSPVTYVSGDTNDDDVLQTGETWVFTGTADLDETTTNTGTAHGTGGGETVTDTDQVTVVVSVETGPAIHVQKTAHPSAMVSGVVPVTFTYTVTNTGSVALTDVSVTDDKLSPVTYVSGDANEDGVLQTTETWIFTGAMDLSKTTTNIATAHGSADGVDVTDAAAVEVVVTSTGGRTRRTVSGGALPHTATPWWGILLAGVASILLGGSGYLLSTAKGRE